MLAVVSVVSGDGLGNVTNADCSTTQCPVCQTATSTTCPACPTSAPTTDCPQQVVPTTTQTATTDTNVPPSVPGVEVLYCVQTMQKDLPTQHY